MSRNDNYPTGSLVHYLYQQNYNELVGIDLSRQTNTNTLQQINFIGKFKEGDGATIFFIADKLF